MFTVFPVLTVFPVVMVTVDRATETTSSSSQGQACETKRKCTLGTLDPVAQKEVSVYVFLRNSGRKVYMVKGDGNCLFRSMSYEVFKTEEHHFKLCNNVVWLISLTAKSL